jgi:hypothetical protein
MHVDTAVAMMSDCCASVGVLPASNSELARPAARDSCAAFKARVAWSMSCSRHERKRRQKAAPLWQSTAPAALAEVAGLD